MTNVFSNLIEQIAVAVNFAAAQAHDKNKELFLSFFDRVETVTSTNDEKADSAVRYLPKLVNLEYPIVEDGKPGTHSVGVPLIALADHAAMHLHEFRLNMTLEIRHDSAGNIVGLSPVRTRDGEGGGAPGAAPSFAHIEMTMKRGERGQALVDIVEGYDKAVRAQVPG